MREAVKIKYEKRRFFYKNWLEKILKQSLSVAELEKPKYKISMCNQMVTSEIRK